MKPTHTPTPWIINGRYIDCEQGELICYFPQSSDLGTDQEDVKEMGVSEKRYQANAAFIVRAVNSHQALIDALTAATDRLEYEYSQFLENCDHNADSDTIQAWRMDIDNARATLKTAKGE